MTLITDRNKPFNGFFSNVLRVSQVMDLGGTGPTMLATPIISLEYYITLSLPSIRFKIVVPIIIPTPFTFYIINYKGKGYYK